MRESVTTNAVGQLSIAQLKTYLIGTDWIQDGEIGSIATIWHRPSSEHSDSEVLLPEDDSIKDYLERVLDVVLVLSQYENRTARNLIEEISRQSSDLVRVRVVHDDVLNGTIPLEDGVLLIEKARELLSAATLATLARKKYFSGNRPPEAVDFIERARLGQTEAGSYIINVHLPIEKPDADLFQATSFTRCVITTLANSLHAVDNVVEIIKKKDDRTLIDDSVAEGVSANLCDALIGLSGDNKSRNVEISFTLSRSEPSEIEENYTYMLESNSIPYLQEASDYLKDNYVVKDTKVSGMVKKLDRSPGEESGMVSILAVVGDRERSVSFELGAEEYLHAIHAHENNEIVEYSGDVYVGPRSAKLINGRDFRVFGNRSLF